MKHQLTAPRSGCSSPCVRHCHHQTDRPISDWAAIRRIASVPATPLASPLSQFPAAIAPTGILMRRDPATVRMARMGGSDAHVVLTLCKPFSAAGLTSRDVLPLGCARFEQRNCSRRRFGTKKPRLGRPVIGCRALFGYARGVFRMTTTLCSFGRLGVHRLGRGSQTWGRCYFAGLPLCCRRFAQRMTRPLGRQPTLLLRWR